jgi:hypothetical protein
MKGIEQRGLLSGVKRTKWKVAGSHRPDVLGFMLSAMENH